MAVRERLKNADLNSIETNPTILDVRYSHPLEYKMNSKSTSGSKNSDRVKMKDKKDESYESIKNRIDTKAIFAFAFGVLGNYAGLTAMSPIQEGVGVLLLIIGFYLAVTVRGNLGQSNFDEKHFKD